MKDSWFSLGELCGLLGMPDKVSGVRRKADREQWQSRDRVGRGGGKEFQIPDRYLTPELIAALQEKFGEQGRLGMKKEPPSESSETKDESFMTGGSFDLFGGVLISEDTFIPPTAQPKSDTAVAFEEPSPNWEETTSRKEFARIELVKRWQSYIADAAKSGFKEVGASETFVRGVLDGSIPIPDWVKQGLQTKGGKLTVSRASLQVWRNQTPAQLAAKHQGRESFFDQRPEYATAAEAVMREFGASAKRIFFAFESGLIKEEFGLNQVPTYNQIAGWLRKLDAQNHQKQRAFATGDKSILLAAQGSYSRGLKPNDRWEVDSTKGDVWLLSPHGETMVRWAIVACIDVATRYLKLLLVPSSKGEAICLLLAACIGEWGLPKEVKTDNGKDYIGRRVQGFLRAMSVEQKLCVVKQPWQKPHIERSMRTLQHSQEWELLPWNTGHNVAQQQAKRKLKEDDVLLPWTSDRFQNWLDQWTEAYHNRLNEGLGCTPNEGLAAFRADGFVALMPKNLDKNLTFALMQEQLVTVNKGGIKYNGRFYVAPELNGRVGDKLAMRIGSDPNTILVYSCPDTTTAELICIAKWDMALTPTEQAAIATAKPKVEQAQLDHEQAVKKAQRNLRKKIAANPEQLLPERGGVAAMRATQQIEAATQNLVNQIEAATSPKEVMPDVAKLAEYRDRQKTEQAEQAKREAPKYDFQRGLQRVFRLWKQGEDPQTVDIIHAQNYLSTDGGRGVLFAVSDGGNAEQKKFSEWLYALPVGEIQKFN
jgi:putative transposase